jgi:hypothetical protein
MRDPRDHITPARETHLRAVLDAHRHEGRSGRCTGCGLAWCPERVAARAELIAAGVDPRETSATLSAGAAVVYPPRG